jgi:nucleoside-diphosphate-sugar epimerase
MSTATVITGATGYIGSHLAYRLLKSHPARTVVCLARGGGDGPARERVRRAVRRAAHDQGESPVPDEQFTRLAVWEEDLNAPTVGGVPEWVAALRPQQFWHCAASIKFLEEPDRSVRTTNVDGVARALDLATRAGASVFNHVSTAYVAGTRAGLIPEALPPAGCEFNNVYEETKAEGERMVVSHCESHGLGFRVLRPSIVVGHSRTFRTSSDSGVFRVAELGGKFARMAESRGPGAFDRRPLRVRIDPAAMFNAVPIDAVIAEMAYLNSCGDLTLNQFYHLTSEHPLSSFEAIRTLLGMVGIDRVEPAADEAEMGPLDRLFDRGLRAYGPYFNGRMEFDRHNVRRHGAGQYQKTCPTGVGVLQRMVEQYLAALAQPCLASA